MPLLCVCLPFPSNGYQLVGSEMGSQHQEYLSRSFNWISIRDTVDQIVEAECQRS